MTTRRRRLEAVVALILGVCSTARAGDEDAVLRRAAELLEEVSSSPDSGIPARFLREARGITIVPHLVETQLGLGRRLGHGVYLPRDEEGKWGAPELVRMAGLSAGPEAGRRVTDMVTIYRTRKAADKAGNQSLALGASFNIAYKDLLRRSSPDSRRFSGPGSDSTTAADVLTYTRARGRVVGARFLGEHNSRTELSAAPGPQAKDVGADVAPAGHPDRRADPGGGSPEAARLKAVLAALTAPPAAELAAKGTNDPRVRPASVTSPPPGAVLAPR